MNRRSPRMVAALSALVLAAGGARTEAAEVVARAGKTEVTIDQVRAYLGTLEARERAALAKDPALLSQVVRAFLARLAVLQEARDRRWDEQPAVKAQLDRARDDALAELYLARVSAPPEGYPGDAEVGQAYEANRAAFEVPRQYRVAQIFLATAKGDAAAAEKARKRIGELAGKAREPGADFAALARAESEEKESAPRGGEIGWLAEAQMVPGIRRVVAGLASGGISEPVQLEGGWHLLKLLETRPPSTRPLAEVREALAAELRAERAKQDRQAYLARLLERSPPAINELALAKVLAPQKAKRD